MKEKYNRREFLGFAATGLAFAGSNKLTAKEEGINRIIEPGIQPEVFVDGTLKEPYLNRTEGPAWVDSKLYFSNYASRPPNKNGILTVKLDGTHQFYDLGVTSNGITPLHNGNLAVCFIRMASEELPLKSGILEMTPDGEWIDTIVEKYNGLPLGYPNDLITDSKQGIYFTDPHGGDEILKKFGVENQPGTSVYYLTPDKELIRLTEWNEINKPNGCVLSSDGSKFYLSSKSNTVTVFDVNSDGTLSNKSAFAQLKIHENQVGGDGMTIDREGNLYVAVTQVGIQIFDKKGNSIGILEFPDIVSNCIFGGDDLSTLFVTTFGKKVYSIQTKMRGFQYPLR